jgi:hypothetical protein
LASSGKQTRADLCYIGNSASLWPERLALLIEADESDRMDPRRLKVLQSLQRVFEDEYGIEFFAASENSGEGVRFRKT